MFPKSSENISVKKTLICLKSVVLVSRLTYFHYFLFQLITVTRNFITNFGTVIINDSHRIAQELGNLHTVTDKGEDTQFNRYKDVTIFFI